MLASLPNYSEVKQRMYIIRKRVAYSEIDSSGRMTIPAILDTLQDCATFHSQDVGITLDWLMREHLAWVTASWRLKISRFPVFGEELEIETRPYKLAHSIGKRAFEIRVHGGERDGENGESLILADSQWVFSDVLNGKNVNLPADFVDRFGIDEPFPGSISPRRRLKTATDMEAHEPFIVGVGQLDTNNHVNNVQYVRAALPYFPQDIHEFMIEYRRSAHLGDVIIPKTADIADIDEKMVDANLGSADLDVRTAGKGANISGTGAGRVGQYARLISLDAADGRPYVIMEVR